MITSDRSMAMLASPPETNPLGASSKVPDGAPVCPTGTVRIVYSDPLSQFSGRLMGDPPERINF